MHWRFALLGGLTAGLAASPWLRGGGSSLAVASAIALTALIIARSASWTWIGCIAIATAALGLAIGDARLTAIDAGALEVRPGSELTVRGFVTAVPKRSDGTVRIRVQTSAGRLLVEVPEPIGDLGVGSGIEAAGTTREPSDWERRYLRRLGVGVVLEARRLEPTAVRRGGLVGLLDGVRERAEAALSRGTGPDASDLLRGFVLGEDDRIDPETVDQFKRSGLAHILAVSGQNVILLAVLAAALLGALGVPRRARLLWILGLIAVYIPVAGAGASIQRAGVMGAAGVVAALASRPRARWYALLLAACATLAIDPRASSDVGWQLSFAAVLGILLWSHRIAAVLGGEPGSTRAALAEGAAMTLAATIATAPLMAHHFGAISLTSIPANLVALPAEAPVMWLGMLAAAIGQLSWIPVEPVTALGGVCAGYIAQVAAWFGSRSAQAEIELGGAGLAGAYLVLTAAVTVALRWAGRRGRLAPRSWRSLALAAAALGAFALAAAAAPGSDPTGPEPGLRVSFLDVGQGDSILLDPRRGDPLLVDAGPADAAVAAELAGHGVDRLAALVETHRQADHIGGVADVLDRVRVKRLVYAERDRATLTAARGAGAAPVRIAAGDRLRSGALRLDVLWPPAERLRAAAGSQLDPNLLCLVILARWHGFELLLTGDAEAQDAAVGPGDIDVLKVAHHGSDDAGLDALLDRTRPGLAVISVGAGNPYGHPAASTVATLAAHDVATLRTDLDGEVTIDVERDGWSVR
jgi:competence protein ComEC